MGHYGCDESKCVSKGLSNIFNGSFTCYGDEDGEFYPMMCADGFLPFVVDEDDDETSSPQMKAPTAEGQGSNGLVSSMVYFTCCPPQQHRSATTPVRRRCSDPFIVPIDSQDGGGKVFEKDAICWNQNVTRRHPRPMKANTELTKTFFGYLPTRQQDSFLCCDDEHDQNYYPNSTSVLGDGFLEDAQCVPYRNEYYQASRVQNQLGNLPLISCDFSDGDFSIPRSINNNSDSISALRGQYLCCKTGPALETIFVEDSAFKITLYLPIAFSCIAVVVSIITFLGLLIPLLKQLRNGSYRRVNIRTSNLKVYSTYNLYLVYMALFDGLSYSFFIVLYALTAGQKFYPGCNTALVSPPPNVDSVPLGFVVLYATMVANVWINGFIIYQVLALLRASKNSRRVKQLSLTRVSLEAGSTLIIAMLSGLGLYINIVAIQNEMNDGNEARYKALTLACFVWSNSVVFLPISYSIYASVLVWKGGYISMITSVSERAHRDLAIYFFRIIMVFFGVWIPGILLAGYLQVSSVYWGNILVICLWAGQPAITFCLILTKPDIRKYIWDLVTLRYLFEDDQDQVETRTIFSFATRPDTTGTTAGGASDEYAAGANKGAGEAGDGGEARDLGNDNGAGLGEGEPGNAEGAAAAAAVAIVDEAVEATADLHLLPGDEGADMDEYQLTSVDELLDGIYGDHAHANDGTQVSVVKREETASKSALREKKRSIENGRSGTFVDT